MPTHTFILNGKQVSVDVDDDVRLLWVLRDLLGVTGPKYGCGLDVCKACTSHINGKAFNPCSVQVKDIDADRRDHHDRGPAGHGRHSDLHPMQEAWLDVDVAAVRLLPARPDHGRRREGEAGPGRGARDQRRRLRRDPQHLPLRHLPPHPGGHRGRRGEDVNPATG